MARNVTESVIKVREFTNGMNMDGVCDVDEKMTTWFAENPDVEIVSVNYAMCSDDGSSRKSALLLYKEHSAFGGKALTPMGDYNEI